MQNIQQIVNSLIDKKAKKNNTIDLNAYAVGALDALEKSKYTEMLDLLQRISVSLENIWMQDDSNEVFDLIDAEELDNLIKEATEL